MKHKKQKMISLTSNKQQGFTLVEFMVASVLGLVVIAGAGSLYSYTKRLNDVGMARVATLQDLRSAATMIGQDARTAGVFGCASLGRRYAPDVVDVDGAAIPSIPIPANLPAIAQLQTLDGGQVGSVKDRSAGVRWIKASDAKNLTGIWGAGFGPQSGVLLFYYGEGSLSYNSSNGSNQVTFNTNEQHPNQVVKTVLDTAPGGYVVAAGCNAIAIADSDGSNTGTTFAVNNIPANAPSSGTLNNASSGVMSSILPHSDMILQRYKVVAYVVGNLAGVDELNSSSLYRFEFGNNGTQWSGPLQLAKNVKSMTARYLFVTDCPSSLTTNSSGTPVTEAELNGQSFTVQNADDGDAFLDVHPEREAQGPSSVSIELIYNFPKIRGGSVATGKVKADGVTPEDEEFNITAVVRGGNVCASRKIFQ